MDRKQQVFVRLKLKAKALGFNVKELKGIAAKIAGNLTSADDASDEDVNAEIDTAIDGAMSYLSFGQSQANRLLDEWKKNHPETDEEEEEDEETPANPKSGSNKRNPNNKEKNGEEPVWFKTFREQQEARIAALEGDKVTTSRKAKLENVLKDAGTFGTRTLKSFSKMNFENDEEFEDFLSEVTEDLKAYNQERADAGLSTMGAPPAAGGGKPKADEQFSDNEIDEIANIL